MSQYLVLSHIDIQNANTIAGLTWGFPAITQFLGFTHALSRKISATYGGDYPTELNGCAVVSHQTNNKVYQPKPFADFEFVQSKNPPVLSGHKAKSSPPIIEEGKVNLNVSLIIELSNDLALTPDKAAYFESYITSLCYKMRIAGGTVLHISKVKFISDYNDEILLKKIKRLCMPGFVLKDQSAYLANHIKTIREQAKKESPKETSTLLDAWLDFSALKAVAQPKLATNQTEPDAQTDAEWNYQPKPFSGYLVPLMTGYKAISQVYSPGEVEDTRDQTTPTCFVEAIHSVGEWLCTGWML